MPVRLRSKEQFPLLLKPSNLELLETSLLEENDYLQPEIEEISSGQFNSRVSPALAIPGTRSVDIPSASSQTIRPPHHRLPQQTIHKTKTFQILGRHSELARQSTVKKAVNRSPQSILSLQCLTRGIQL
jgi:hypothetical protein